MRRAHAKREHDDRTRRLMGMTRKLGGFAAALGVSALVSAALIVALAARAPSAISPEGARETAVARPAPVPERLPDLDQETPTQLQVQNSVVDGRRSYRLGFRS